MLAAFLESAFRSLLLAGAVWAGLRAFRIRDVLAQKRAWAAVLAGAVLMPAVLLLSAQWHGLPAASLPIPARFASLQATLEAAPRPVVPDVSATSEASQVSILASYPLAAAKVMPERPATASSLQLDHFNSAPRAVNQTPTWHAFNSPATTALALYLIVAAVLLVRLLFGLMYAMYLWHKSAPIPPVTDVPFGADLTLRWSHRVSAPVTIGSGIVLPADYKSWTREKIRMVLAHERSHVRQRDFQLQLVASLYAALVWFSPLGWWLKRKLSDLGEAISDCSGIEQAETRTSYAQILLEFAAAPRPTLIGVAMARPSSISRRIERLLNESALRKAFAGGRRARIAVVLVPVVLFAAFALVRVQAAGIAPEQIAPELRRAEPKMHVPAAARAVLLAASSPSPRELSAATVPATPAVPATPGTSPAPPDPPIAPPPPTHAYVQNAAAQTEATFDRTLTFNGKLDLSVSTGCGEIHMTRGTAGQVRVHGVVKSSDPDEASQVQSIAANPPIEQNGNIIQIGSHHDGENHNNTNHICIAYQVEAPADASLKAATGSGNITDEGVGHDTKLMTGSGNITATGLEGDFKTQTGSGNIAIDGSGQGDAKAQTGSGNIDLKGVHGSLDAQTGSGRIKATGTPSSAWKLQTGSGSIELSTGKAPMNLDLSTGSGKISTEPAIAMQASENKHHVTGQLNGGGPEVKIQTGSGDIQIQ